MNSLKTCVYYTLLLITNAIVYSHIQTMVFSVGLNGAQSNQVGIIDDSRNQDKWVFRPRLLTCFTIIIYHYYIYYYVITSRRRCTLYLYQGRIQDSKRGGRHPRRRAKIRKLMIFMTYLINIRYIFQDSVVERSGFLPFSSYI